MKHRVARTVFVAMMLAAALPGSVGAANAAATDKPGLSHVSLVMVTSKQGVAHPEAELLLSNASDKSLFFAGYSADSPVYQRQCLAADQWKNGDMGWCGNGMETQTLEPGQQVRFHATLCSDSNATKIGLAIAAIEDEPGEVLWSDEIRPPPFTSSGRMPDFPFDEGAATRKAMEVLRTIGAVGNLGTAWRFEKPEVAGVQVSDTEAKECPGAGRYIIVRYEYVDQPAGGPNSIVFEAPSPRSESWQRRGMLTSMSMDDAIAQFRDGRHCD